MLGVLSGRRTADERGRAVKRCLSHACSVVAKPARAGVIDIKPNSKNNRDLDIRYISRIEISNSTPGLWCQVELRDSRQNVELQKHSKF